MNRKFVVFTLAAALLANTVAAAAQERERTRVVVEPPVQDEIFIAQGPGEAPPAPVVAGGDSIVYLATEMSFAGRLVKGAPYSAQAVTESIQTLSDGNRIVRRNTAQVYRDSEGRTRRDQTLGYIGPYSTAGDVPQTVFINDPVAGVNYILDPSSKTARKLPRVELRFKAEGGDAKADSSGAEVRRKIEVERTFTRIAPGPEAPAAQTGTAVIVAPPAPPEGAGPVEFHFSRSSSKAETKSEKLEPRSFDGVTAEGTRTTTTIPAGELGNEQPIQIVSERWYSPELQVVVMTRHSDPRTGETTYRLTNLSRTEPAAALFQVPADYTLKEVPTTVPVRRMRRPNTAPPAPQEN